MKSPAHMPEADIVAARDSEEANQPLEAVKIYEALLKLQPSNENILTRLIINFRKLKNYKKELKYIEALLKLHESFYTPQNKKAASIISLSEKINRSLGATDKQGRRHYSDAFMIKLEKRKMLVIQKINVASK